MPAIYFDRRAQKTGAQRFFLPPMTDCFAKHRASLIDF
jgi:hypothetical protein